MSDRKFTPPPGSRKWQWIVVNDNGHGGGRQRTSVGTHKGCRELLKEMRDDPNAAKDQKLWGNYAIISVAEWSAAFAASRSIAESMNNHKEPSNVS